MHRWASLTLAIWVAGAASGLAQEPNGAGYRAMAIDSVIGVQDFVGDDGQWKTQYVFDVASSVELAPGIQATFRPKLWRSRGAWLTLVDQASVRYEFRKGSNWRIEVGRFPSPMGLGLTENRPNLSPAVVWYYRPYYMPLPSLGTGAPRLSLISTVYPDGAQITTSTARWDARGALMDRAPVEFWNHDPGRPRRANVMAGGGFTPRQGLRFGAAVATGQLPTTPAHGPDWRYHVLNLEAEWAFNATKLTAEWVQDEFALPSGRQTAKGWTVQGRQTLAPRVFAHARLSTVDAPAASGRVFVRRDYWAVDSTIGYLVNPEVTVRVGHAATKAFTGTDVDHQVGVSVMWFRRWW